ncbi:hypothetical protein C0J52_15468 [Blattella germanica]|nr:hypothetical protein C0J52_15468 [Blattella germanica]
MKVITRAYGHFLLLRLQSPLHDQVQVWSPTMVNTISNCTLEVWMLMYNMTTSEVKLVMNGKNPTEVNQEQGNSHGKWEQRKYKIGKKLQPFNLILEVVPGDFPALFALDSLRLINCFKSTEEPTHHNGECKERQFRCKNNKCIDRSRICDLHKDCPDGEDEQQDCDKLPSYSHCNFEQNWCGWTNRMDRDMRWLRKQGESSDEGIYAYVNTSMVSASTPHGRPLGEEAVFESPEFHPPPCYHSRVESQYYNSCSIRFSYYMTGPNSIGLEVRLIEIHPHENKKKNIFWGFHRNERGWNRAVAVFPNITHRYFIQFHAVKGISRANELGVDNISMSPECFGLGVPPEETQGYVYNSTYCYGAGSKIPNENFYNKTVYTFTTCGINGREGPTHENCTKAYQFTTTNVTVTPDGIQRWTVPETGYYTIIAKGASGGSGPMGGSSSGATVRSILELHRGQHIYMLIGQEGTNGRTRKSQTNSMKDFQNKIVSVRKLNNFTYSAGGGGGGTFVFMVSRDNRSIPLMVAAGGGGLSHSYSEEERIQHGHGQNSSRGRFSGQEFGDKPAGAGGGWEKGGPTRKETGQALQDGALGGKGCIDNRNGDGAGGFGGGGGGCAAGGGGGGYAGGNAWAQPLRNGEGGYSFFSDKDSAVMEELHHGPGSVLIIPALDKACSCDYRCVALDEYRSEVTCICPENWILGVNNESCELPPEPNITLIVGLLGTTLGILLGLGLLCFCLYNRYQRNKTAIDRRRMLSGPDLQLNSLREASNSMMTEFNPNYEFGGEASTSSSSSSSEKPATVGSLVSLNNNNNNNNNNNPQRNSLKASLSLDPSALAKQQPLPYVNVNVTPSHVAEPEVETQGRPFTVQAALLSENEISC